MKTSRQMLVALGLSLSSNGKDQLINTYTRYFGSEITGVKRCSSIFLVIILKNFTELKEQTSVYT